MNKVLIMLLLIAIGFTSNAQQKISFDYDAAGNQIVRSLCVYCHSKNMKEIKDITEEDLVEFFPGDVISYYPNPVKEQLYLKWKLINDNKVTSIQFYSASGQLLRTINKLENEDNCVMSFLEYPNGLYTIILVYTNGEQKSIKIIK